MDLKIMETNTIPISNKVFNKKDLKRIGKIFVDEYTKSCKNEKSSYINFMCMFCDDRLIDTESPEIFEEDDDTLNLSKSSSLNFTFHDYSDDKNINFKIRQGQSFRNEVIISGSNKEWTGYIINLFNKTLKDIKSQNKIFLKNQVLIFLISYLTFGISSAMLFRLITNTSITSFSLYTLNTSNFIFYEIVIFFFSLLVSGIAFKVSDWLDKLWPSIEFDFGPEDKTCEKNKRKITWAVVKWITSVIGMGILLPLTLMKLFK